MPVTKEKETCFIPLDFSSLDFTTTKTDLAQVLEMSRTTLNKYSKAASLIFDDFKTESKARKFLSRYQCWILWFVKAIFVKNKGEWTPSVRELKKARNLMTVENFEKYKTTTDSDIQTLLKGDS